MQNEELKTKFVGVRVQTCLDKNNYLKRLKHNTRHTKQKAVKNDSGIDIFNIKTGEWERIEADSIDIGKSKSDYSIEVIDRAKQDYDKIVQEHKKINKSFHSKKTRSIAEGVLYFSEGINEDYEKDEIGFKNKLLEFIKDFEEKNQTDILDFQIHKDEVEFKKTEKIGNIHIHFTFKNFNRQTGKSLNFTNNKDQGSAIQDLCFTHFKDFGQKYQRGIKRDSPMMNLSIHKYRALKSAEEKVKNLKKENSKLKKQNEILSKNQTVYKNNADILQNRIKDYRKIEAELIQRVKTINNQYEITMEDIITDLEDLKEEEDVQGFLNKIRRSLKASKTEKIDKLLVDYRKNLDNLRKKKNKELSQTTIDNQNKLKDINPDNINRRKEDRKKVMR